MILAAPRITENCCCDLNVTWKVTLTSERSC